MKKFISFLAVYAICAGFFTHSMFAHPGSGIVVDKYGNVYFIHTYTGIVKISPDGKVVYIKKILDGHWMCLDEQGVFSLSRPKYFERITPDGVKPAIIYAGGGSPIAIGKDGSFYYCGGPGGDLNPGALSLVRENVSHQQSVFCPDLENTLKKLDDGITGLAASPEGSIYVSCWNSVLKISADGKLLKVIHPVIVAGCDEDPADHKESNRGKPLLRGISVDSAGVVYAAATSCHCVIMITPDGNVKTILKSERPWSPTGVTVRNGNVYVLEYTNANGPAKEGWSPRVRRLGRDGKISTIADLSQVTDR